LAYLASHNVLTLATSGPEGVWAAALFYASDRFQLYFLSAGTTRHGRNLAANPRVAATIQEDYKDWPAIQGIQLEGAATLLGGAEQEDAMAIYLAKFPFVANPSDPRMQAALPRMNLYRLAPERLYFINNQRGLGHRGEVALSER
jgi:uncharacterized protein YhbP (UPF0306 family)